MTSERWRDLAELFERKGPRGGFPMTAGCWCMWWRKRTGDPAKNKRNMRTIVRAGKEPGLLAYSAGEPIGWVSIAPREEFGQLFSSRVYRPHDDDAGVFSLVCFYVDRREKRQGVAGELLDAAVAHARRRGASAIEAYPHASDRRDYMGTKDLFRQAGFKRVGNAGKRTIVRLPLRSLPSEAKALTHPG
ncbi:MAG: GNAT family N-acetyltransferase, partial [Actinomycetota bacterium]|nr:GNAT family N-acetyltransferase [Actinomycetota bacterium]